MGAPRGEEDDLLGFMLVASGATLGPSAGHFYAKQFSRGLKTAGLRIGFVGVGTIGFLASFCV